MKTYVGIPSVRQAGARLVEVREDGVTLGLLAHHPKHSPDGFSWGYAGSGPAELARCLLIDHFGGEAWCPVCEGRGQVLWTEDGEGTAIYIDGRLMGRCSPASEAQRNDPACCSCPSCGEEKTSFAPSLYQRFKAEFVAKFHRYGWSLTSDQIEAWLRRQPDGPRNQDDINSA